MIAPGAGRVDGGTDVGGFEEGGEGGDAEVHFRVRKSSIGKCSGGRLADGKVDAVI